MDTQALVPVDTTDAQLVALWLRGRPVLTQKSYSAESARFMTWVGKPLRAVTLVDLHDYLDTLDHLADTSRARALSAIKSLLTFAHKTGYLAMNVGAAVKGVKVKNKLAERIMSESEVARLLALESNARNHAILRLLYSGGLRASEVAALRWHDFAENGDTGQVTVYGKGEKTRFVLLSGETWREVMALRGDAGADDVVFVSRKKNGRAPVLTGTQVWQIAKNAAKRAGLKPGVSPHWLRHAHASHALDRGAPISLVRDTLGHASIATTGKYAHARPKESSSKYLPL